MVTALEAVERYLVPHRIAKLMTRALLLWREVLDY